MGDKEVKNALILLDLIYQQGLDSNGTNKLDTVNANLDSLETKADATNTSLDNIETALTVKSVYTSSAGLKTATALRAAGVTTVLKDVRIQNHNAEPLKIKMGTLATTSDYDVIINYLDIWADTIPDTQAISCFSVTTPSYTYWSR
jgi:hypothetical protein